jgi:hypothetical protein
MRETFDMFQRPGPSQGRNPIAGRELRAYKKHL